MARIYLRAKFFSHFEGAQEPSACRLRAGGHPYPGLLRRPVGAANTKPDCPASHGRMDNREVACGNATYKQACSWDLFIRIIKSNIENQGEGVHIPRTSGAFNKFTPGNF